MVGGKKKEVKFVAEVVDKKEKHLLWVIRAIFTLSAFDYPTNIGTTGATSTAAPVMVTSDGGRSLGCSRLP